MAVFTNPRYNCLLVVELVLLLIDVLVHSTALLALARLQIAALVLFVVQDVALVFALITLLLALVNTFAFTAGLMGVLLKKHALPIGVGLAYLVITLTFQGWILGTRWGSYEYRWTGWLQAMYVVHKLAALCYYYLYKRAMYRLSDPKLYQDSEWVRDKSRLDL